MNVNTLLPALLMIISSIQGSPNVDPGQPVIITSTHNYPDSMIASGPSSRYGIPVLLTERNHLPEPTREALSNMSPEKAIIIGGPSVISDNTSSQIDNYVEGTVRLWNITQIGTSLQVSRYFWPGGAETVSLVQYPAYSEKPWLRNGHLFLSSVRAHAIDAESPVLIAQEGRISDRTLSEIRRLDPERVNIFSLNPVKAVQQLNNIGISNISVSQNMFSRNYIENPADMIQHEAVDEQDTHVVVMAARDHLDTLGPVTAPNTGFFWVNKRTMFKDAVYELNNPSPPRITVTGDREMAPDLARKIEDSLNTEVELVTGTPAEITASMLEKDLHNWSKKARNYSDWIRAVEKHPEYGSPEEFDQKFNEDSDKLEDRLQKLAPIETYSLVKDSGILKEHKPLNNPYKEPIPRDMRPIMSITSSADLERYAITSRHIEILDGSAALSGEYGGQLGLIISLREPPEYLSVNASGPEKISKSEIKMKIKTEELGSQSKIRHLPPFEIKDGLNTWKLPDTGRRFNLVFFYGRSSTDVEPPKINAVTIY